MNMRGRISCAVPTLLLGIAAAQATDLSYDLSYNPSWYVTPSVNYLRSDSKFGADRNGYGIGLRFGKAFSPNWDFQVGSSYSLTNNDDPKYEQTTLGVDWLYLFSRERFRPFLLAGWGAEHDKISGAGSGVDASHTSGYVNAGVGFQYSWSDKWSTQVDFRRVHGFLDNDEFNFDRANNNYLTVGLTYTFDVPKKQVAASEPVRASNPAPAPAPTKPAPNFERQTLSATELFEFNSATLGPTQAKLDEIADALNTDKSIDDVQITGYTDRLGSRQYNLALSQRRADAVKTYLVGKGVDASRLTAQGKGPDDPVVTCTEKKRAALIKCLEPNRRVEVEQITIERRAN